MFIKYFEKWKSCQWFKSLITLPIHKILSVHPQQDTMKNRPFQLSLNYIYSGTDHVKAIKQKKDLKARSMTALTSCVKQSWKYTIMDKVIRNGTDPQTHWFNSAFRLPWTVFSHALWPIGNCPLKFQKGKSREIWLQWSDVVPFQVKGIQQQSPQMDCVNFSLQLSHFWLHSGFWGKPGPAESNVPIHAN